MRQIKEIESETISELMEEIVDHLMEKIDEKGSNALASSHEIYGVVAEEFGELLDSIRKNDKSNIETELKDIIVAAIWGLASIRQGETTW